MTKHTFITLFLLVLAISLIFLPTLKLPFSLIDDGESIRVSAEISKQFSQHHWAELTNVLIEKNFGRFRIGYWLYLWAYQHIFGLSPFYQHVGRVLMTSILMIEIFFLGLITIQSLLIATISGIFFFFFFPSMENFIRLGPAEIPQLLLILSFILSIITQCIRNRKFSLIGLFLLTLCLTLAFAIKENSIIVCPILFLIFLFNKTNKLFNKQLLGLFVYCCLLTALVIAGGLVVRHVSGNYSSWYRFDIETILYSFQKYTYMFQQSLGILFIIVPISLTRLLIKALTNRLNRTDKYQLIFWTWFFAGLVVQLPWSFPLGRYLITFLPGLALAMAIEIKIIFSQISPPWFRYLLLLGLLCFFLTKNTIGYFNYLNDYQSREITNYQAVAFLAKNSPPNSIIVMNFSKELNAIEWFVETKLHFDYLYNRPDLSVIRPDEISPIKPSYLAVWSEYPMLKDQQLKDYLNINKAKPVVSYSATSYSIYASPLRFIKRLVLNGIDYARASIIIRPKTYRWAIYQL